MVEMSQYEQAYVNVVDAVECGYDYRTAIEEVSDFYDLTDKEYDQLFKDYEKYALV